MKEINGLHYDKNIKNNMHLWFLMFNFHDFKGINFVIISQDFMGYFNHLSFNCN